MANIKKSAEELIGRTPLMELVNYEKAAGVTDAVILAKLEYFNPAGSVKDRIALQMILDAEEQGDVYKRQLFRRFRGMASQFSAGGGRAGLL